MTDILADEEDIEIPFECDEDPLEETMMAIEMEDWE